MKYRLIRSLAVVATAVSLLAGFRKGEHTEDSKEEPEEHQDPSIHTVPAENNDDGYFIEESYHTNSQESEFWLGKYGSEQKIWIGSSETMNRKKAEERVKKMLERGIRVF